MANQKNTKYNEIKNYLLSLIAQNSDTPDYRLPSELEVARQFNASRITSKRAFDILEQEHLIKRIQGSGSYVNNEKADSPTETVSSTKNIALLVPDLKSNFITSIIYGAEQTLKEKDYSMFLAITDYNQQNEQTLISKFIDLNISGFIIYPVDNQIYNEKILQLILNNFPIVFIDRVLPGITVNNVSSAHTHDSMQVVEKLIEFGHRNIGIISASPQGTTTIERRLDGYRKALLMHDIPLENRRMFTDWKHYAPDWEQPLENFLDKNPDMTALIATGSDMGYKTLRTLFKRKIRIPEDMSVIIYDDDHLDILQLMNINPARLHQSPFEIGVNAAKLVMKSIENPKTPPSSVRPPSTFTYGNTILNLNTGKPVEDQSVIQKNKYST